MTQYLAVACGAGLLLPFIDPDLGTFLCLFILDFIDIAFPFLLPGLILNITQTFLIPHAFGVGSFLSKYFKSELYLVVMSFDGCCFTNYFAVVCLWW